MTTEALSEAPETDLPEASEGSQEQVKAVEQEGEQTGEAPEVPEADTRPWNRRIYQDALDAYDKAATTGEGVFWGGSPASLRTLKECHGKRVKATDSLIHKAWRGLYAGFALSTCSGIQGLLWVLRKPISTPSEGDGPPSLSHLRNDIRAHGLGGRIYGYGLVGWTHVLGYGLIFLLQLQGRLGVALLWTLAIAAKLIFF